MQSKPTSRSIRFITFFAAVALAPLAVAAGCAKGNVTFDDSNDDTGPATVGSGAGGMGGGSTTGTGGTTGGCAIDCTTIATPDCQQAQCNTQTGQCEIVPSPDGGPCDDGLFCTTADTCMAGTCVGGPTNDCGMNAGPCDDLVCDETSQTCSVTPLPDGSTCTPADLCQTAATCLFGQCQGTPKDCFFFPVPDDCHVAQCNPMNGMCEAVVGNEGGTCSDLMDLCTVNKTCATGVCQGGGPKDCSAQTRGCNIGVCDTASGQCTQMAVMNGGMCDDLNACTTGETCNNGQCNGGTAITQCIGGDLCCPAGCTQANDADCSCNVNNALTAVAAVNPGGGSTSPYTPDKMNNGVGEPQNGCSSQGFAWMNNSQTSPGYATLTWTSLVTVGSMYIDSEHATAPACGTNGRNIASATIEYQNASNTWVTLGTISGMENYMYVLPSPVQAKALRLSNVLSSTGNGNTIIHEWYVWPGSNCPTPTPN